MRSCVIFQHLFAVTTKHNGRDRKYYLAAESDAEMNKWVDCLCKVCGFKADTEADDGGYHTGAGAGVVGSIS